VNRASVNAVIFAAFMVNLGFTVLHVTEGSGPLRAAISSFLAGACFAILVSRLAPSQEEDR